MAALEHVLEDLEGDQHQLEVLVGEQPDHRGQHGAHHALDLRLELADLDLAQDLLGRLDPLLPVVLVLEALQQLLVEEQRVGQGLGGRRGLRLTGAQVAPDLLDALELLQHGGVLAWGGGGGQLGGGVLGGGGGLGRGSVLWGLGLLWLVVFLNPLKLISLLLLLVLVLFIFVLLFFLLPDLLGLAPDDLLDVELSKLPGVLGLLALPLEELPQDAQTLDGEGVEEDLHALHFAETRQTLRACLSYEGVGVLHLVEEQLEPSFHLVAGPYDVPGLHDEYGLEGVDGLLLELPAGGAVESLARVPVEQGVEVVVGLDVLDEAAVGGLAQGGQVQVPEVADHRPQQLALEQVLHLLAGDGRHHLQQQQGGQQVHLFLNSAKSYLGLRQQLLHRQQDLPDVRRELLPVARGQHRQPLQAFGLVAGRALLQALYEEVVVGVGE